MRASFDDWDGVGFAPGEQGRLMRNIGPGRTGGREVFSESRRDEAATHRRMVKAQLQELQELTGEEWQHLAVRLDIPTSTLSRYAAGQAAPMPGSERAQVILSALNAAKRGVHR